MQEGDLVTVRERCNIPDVRGKHGRIIGVLGQQGSDMLFQVEIEDLDSYWGLKRLISCFESELLLRQAEVKGTCECGADKCKLPFHSTWCPRYSGT